MSLAVLGTTVAVIGSALILSDTTGFFLAGLVSSTRFALIGGWLNLLNRWIASNRDQGWPTRRLTLGKLAGVVMALVIISIAEAVMGLDDMGAAPAGFMWVASVGSAPTSCSRSGAFGSAARWLLSGRQAPRPATASRQADRMPATQLLDRSSGSAAIRAIANVRHSAAYRPGGADSVTPPRETS